MNSPDHDPVPTIILCGGQGTRMRGAAQDVPKPMLPIGGRPVLWHIMKLYGAGGAKDFVLALGHLGDVIREFVLHCAALTSDFRIDLAAPDRLEYLDRPHEEDWRISCVDTGAESLTGTRVRRALRYVDAPRVMVTYGDGLADLDVAALLRFHVEHGRLGTITAVRPPGRFGELTIEGSQVTAFDEKPETSTTPINGGFMVFERAAIELYVPTDDDVALEREPLSALAKDGQLMAYDHRGFWQSMDTPREHELLEELWRSGDAPWKRWE